MATRTPSEEVERQVQLVTERRKVRELGAVTTVKELEELRQTLLCAEEIAFDTETDGPVPWENENGELIEGMKSRLPKRGEKIGGLHHDRKITGYSVATKEGAWYVPLRHRVDPELNVPVELGISVLRDMLCGQGAERRVVWLHNAKFDLKVCRNEGIDPQDIKVEVLDTMVLCWLLNPAEPQGLKHHVTKRLGIEMKPFDSLFKQYGMRSGDVPVRDMAPYAVDDVAHLLPLAHLLHSELGKTSEAMLKVFHELECPVIFVVEEMEHNGVLLDFDRLDGLTKEFQVIASEAHARVVKGLSVTLGEDVPPEQVKLNSPQWLSRTFVDQLRWWGTNPSTEMTATGAHPTDKEHMEKWAAGAVPGTTKKGAVVADCVLRYKGMTKLIGTYTEKLPRVANEDRRVRCNFRQTGTGTGRLSSSDPNLQNIPMRTAEGRRIREAFIARPGFKMICIDFSQIELRLLAHFSKDPLLLRAYIEGVDIHQQTADECDVSRAEGKALNFGLIYGMGAKKLAQQLRVPHEQAAKYRARYFRAYERVVPFQEAMKVQARRDGYVSTLIGRRRYLPDIRSRDHAKAGFAERQAVNTRIQGSAADLIKIGMRNIREEAIKRGWNMKTFFTEIQVHDELLFEAADEIVEEAAAMVREKLENVVTLRVPLVADPAIGPNWLEAK